MLLFPLHPPIFPQITTHSLPPKTKAKKLVFIVLDSWYIPGLAAKKHNRIFSRDIPILAWNKLSLLSDRPWAVKLLHMVMVLGSCETLQRKAKNKKWRERESNNINKYKHHRVNISGGNHLRSLYYFCYINRTMIIIIAPEEQSKDLHVCVCVCVYIRNK